MKLRRLVPLAMAAYGGWRKLSPESKEKVKARLGRPSSRRTGIGETNG